MNATSLTPAEIDATVARIVRPSAFSVPQFLTPSAWLDHGPFAFVLMDLVRPRTFVELGTHGGYSYFAFCQAAKALGLSPRCYAVDTWRGDEHAGFYPEETYQRVERHNEANYADFSRLVRSTFDEAAAHFSDGSIDLLHIDGRHFYDDVKHDYETWRPKLSDRAVVVFHDINVRERQFGVFSLWEELRQQFPSFEFHHGHGLGILGFGSNLPPDFAAFLTAATAPAVADELRRRFSRLGAGIKTEQLSRDQNLRIAELEKDVLRLTSRVEDVLEVKVRELEDRLHRQGTEFHDYRIRSHEQDLRSLRLEAALADKSELASAQALEVETLQGLLAAQQRSLSWRITRPLRSFRRRQLEISTWLSRNIRRIGRGIFRRIPLPLEQKRRILFATLGRIGLARMPMRETALPAAIDFSAAVPFAYPPLAAQPRVAAICHVYYEAMTPELQRYLRNIPAPCDVFISTDSLEKKAIIASFFEGWTSGAVDIRVTRNRGRDIAPKLLAFRDVCDGYELVLHLHTKTSKTANHLDVLVNWRGFILENLLGSPEIVKSLFDAFARRPDLGLIAAQHFEPIRPHLNWGGDFPIAQPLAARMGVVLVDDKVLDFPSGSMFWARTAALKPLLDLNLTFEDFAPERGQMDGTLAHAIERLYFYVCEAAGYKWIKVAHPEFFLDRTAIVPVESPVALDRYMAERTTALTGTNPPAPRAEAPPAVDEVAPALIARLQEKSLGSATPIDPATKVVIGVVTYNNVAEDLRRMLDSAVAALKQAGLATAGRVLVLDNGASSADVTAGNAAIVALPTAGNVGFGAGQNRLMAQAFAEGAEIYIAANPDGAFHPDAVTALVQMVRVHDGRALVEALQFPDEHPKPYDPVTFETPWVSGACLAIPRRAYETLGGFDETFFMYCEDVDLSWRARAQGFVLRTCPRALFQHAVSNRVQTPALLRMIFESGIILARKWHSPKFIAWLTPELAKLGFPPPRAYPAAVPEAWRRIADFEHHMIFAPPRW